jgi:hypothetical protein
MKILLMHIGMALLLVMNIKPFAAQDFVVLNSGDTIYGEVKDRSTIGIRDRMYKRVRFKGNNGRKRYRARQILGYAANGNIYESFPFLVTGLLQDKIVFTRSQRHKKFIQRSFQNEVLTLYYYEFTNDDERVIQSVPFFYLHDKDFMIRATQGLFGLKKRLLQSYFSAYPDLVEQIESGEIKDVNQIVSFFKAL